MSSETPVFSQAYQGWRAWSINPCVHPLQLNALWRNSHVWPARDRTEATCHHTLPWRPWRRNAPAHDQALVPKLDCTCGVVALPHPHGAIEYLEDWEHFIKRQWRYRRRHLLIERYGHARPLPVFGSVSMWGEAIEHESVQDQVTGIRTRFGYPQELWLPASWWDQRPDVDRQAIAVQLEDRYGVPVHPIEDLSDIAVAWKAIQDLES